MNYKKPAFWIVAAAVVACIVVAVCFLTSPTSSPISFGAIQISWAKTLDCRPNDPTGHDLNDAQLDELKSRLSSLNVGSRDSDFGGLTPFYSLSIYAQKVGQFMIACYDSSGNNVALMYHGKYYRVNDTEFAKYLSNVCSGGDISSAQNAKALKWFDYNDGDEMKRDGHREISIEAFPDVTFRCYFEKLEAVTEKETFTLYTGMPIWNVYFCDLTGDGKPELCSTLSIGSGIIDNRIIIYDYAEGASYELSDRGNFDYTLRLQDGSLYVDKRSYANGDLLGTGMLIYRDETIQIQPDIYSILHTGDVDAQNVK